jgi:hypothetical protein
VQDFTAFWDKVINTPLQAHDFQEMGDTDLIENFEILCIIQKVTGSFTENLLTNVLKMRSKACHQ